MRLNDFFLSVKFVQSPIVYLIDTNVISEARKRDKANRGVQRFLAQVVAAQTPLYLSVVTIGELRRGIELIRHRGDAAQAQQLEAWLQTVLTEYADCILPLDAEIAQVWGRLRAPHPEQALDKQIAATALIYSLTVVTRNQRDFEATGVRVLNPFEAAAPDSGRGATPEG
jgi:predicted nucleic acid-binding protein